MNITISIRPVTREICEQQKRGEDRGLSYQEMLKVTRYSSYGSIQAVFECLCRTKLWFLHYTGKEWGGQREEFKGDVGRGQKKKKERRRIQVRRKRGVFMKPQKHLRLKEPGIFIRDLL